MKSKGKGKGQTIPGYCSAKQGHEQCAWLCEFKSLVKQKKKRKDRPISLHNVFFPNTRKGGTIQSKNIRQCKQMFQKLNWMEKISQQKHKSKLQKITGTQNSLSIFWADFKKAPMNREYQSSCLSFLMSQKKKKHTVDLTVTEVLRNLMVQLFNPNQSPTFHQIHAKLLHLIQTLFV